MRVVLPRIGLVLGHEGGLLAALLPMFMAGAGGVVGSGQQVMAWIHLHDLIESLMHALQDGRYSGPYNAVASAAVTNTAFTAALAQASAAHAPFRMPKALMKLAMGEQATIALSSTRAVPGVLRQHNFPFQFETLEAALDNLLDANTLRLGLIDKDSPAPLAHPYVKERRPIYLLEAQTNLSQARHDVFDFFCRAENLGLMTPKDMAMQIIGEPPNPVAQGSEINYTLKVGPMPLRWRTLIAQWQPDSLFVDAQLKGPYRAWWHQHHFEDAGSGTKMTDRVYYAPPMAFLGRAANAVLIKGQLQRIFWFRKSAITLRFGVA
ncbi:MAG: DUF1731 domain-containing protein [Deltaproteobacteria bacterium]|nr:MAG: DUF1731 domain-containing protein [Deltaproteobacteria bacterium]